MNECVDGGFFDGEVKITQGKHPIRVMTNRQDENILDRLTSDGKVLIVTLQKLLPSKTKTSQFSGINIHF